MSGETDQKTQQKTHMFECFEKDMVICGDPQQCVGPLVNIEICPWITERTINKVIDMAGGKVIFSTYARKFVGRFSGYRYWVLAYVVNRAINQRAAEVAREAVIKSGKIPNSYIAVDVDNNNKLEWYLEEEIREYNRAVLLTVYDSVMRVIKHKLYSTNLNDLEIAVNKLVDRLCKYEDLEEAMIELVEKLVKMIDEDRLKAISNLANKAQNLANLIQTE